MYTKQYFLTYKLGNKKTAVAGVLLQHDACLNDAFKAFIVAGYPNPYHHKGYDIAGERLLTQKNYSGKSPLYKEL